MLAGKEYAGVADCSGCGSHKWAYADECQVCGCAGCSECVEVRYLLRCGLHWDGITLGHGCEWVVSVDFANATRFDSEAAVQSMKQRLESRPCSAIHTVVVALVCENCKVAA